MAQITTTNEFNGSDATILAEIGDRVSSERLRRNITQHQLAEEAGISRSTLKRLENGESTQMTAFIRVLRALGLVEGLAMLLPAVAASPMQVLENQGKERQRASTKRQKPDSSRETDSDKWSWGDEA